MLFDMSQASSAPSLDSNLRGTTLALVAMLAFSCTPVASRAATMDLAPLLVGFGRVAVASVLAGAFLLVTRARCPTAEERPALLGAVLGTGFGFPVASALAFGSVPASHGAVVLALLPITTAATAAWRGGERPSLGFWAAAAFGSLAVLAFAAHRGLGGFSVGDVWLLVAVVLGGYGYAEGGRLARTLGGPPTISWVLVTAAPVAVPAALILLATYPPAHVSLSAGLGFAQIAVVSQYLGFFPWYRALSQGSVAVVSTILLAQAPVGVLLSAFLLHEAIDPWTYATLAAVVVAIVGARRLDTGGRRLSLPPEPET